MTEYVLSKTEGEFHDALSTQLRDGHVGLVLSERLVNMPVQVMGPMYQMLAEEMDTAIAEVRGWIGRGASDSAQGRDYRFTHYLFFSRAYRLTADEEEAMLAAQRSKRYKTTSQPSDGLCAFHAEDEEIMAVSANWLAIVGLTCVLQHATDAATFEVEGNRAVRVMVVPRDRFGSLIGSIRVTYGV